MTTLGTASAPPGEMDIGRLPVGEARDGSDVGLPVAVINGRRDGKTLFMQAVSDGDELNGLGVIRRVVPQLDPEEIAGEILIVGIANYYGFLVGEHRNPIDDTKLNRTFPGNESGTASERIAAAVFEAVTRADL
ncbi:MAG: putative deacylase, partial [Natronomonas sp.]